MKKKVLLILLVMTLILAMAGCSQADKVSANLSQEADSFNVVRQLTIINCFNSDVLFQMTGKISITPEPEKKQLVVLVEDENGNYQKHFVGLPDNVTYVVEQKQFKDVDNYKYTLNYNPKMWIPVTIETVD